MEEQAKTLDQLAHDVRRAREEKERIEDMLREATRRVREAEGALIEAMRATGITSFKTGGVVYTRTTKLNVKKTDEHALFDWLRSTGWDGVIKETVHPATLGKVVRETLEAEGHLPPGVEVSEWDVLSIRKS